MCVCMHRFVSMYTMCLCKHSILCIDFSVFLRLFFRFDPKSQVEMHSSSCVIGPQQGTAALLNNNTAQYGGTTWQHQQMSGFGQTANGFLLNDNGLATNRTSNWQNWQSVPPPPGLQTTHFIHESQRNSSSYLSSGSFPAYNFHTQRSKLNNSSPPNTDISSKQDVSQISIQQQQHVKRQKPFSLQLYQLNQRISVASNLNNQSDKRFIAETTNTLHPREKLKDTYKQQTVNNRQDFQTLHQQGLPACARPPPNYLFAIQAKNKLPNRIEHGVGHSQHPTLNQTSPQHQRQVCPVVNVAENITYSKPGHQIGDTRVGFDSIESQTGSSIGSSYTGTTCVHDDGTIPLRRRDHNQRHATLNIPANNWDTLQSLPPYSGQSSSTSNGCSPSASVENDNPAFDKTSFKAVAVVQPLEQECCLMDADKKNCCETADASCDKSASDQQSKTSEKPKDEGSSEISGVKPSVTIIPWTRNTLTKLLVDHEKAQQRHLIELNKANASSFICNVNSLKQNHDKQRLCKMMKIVEGFCSKYVNKHCVILTEAKGSFDDNYCVLKHGELYTELPYKSQWLNVGQLDDIDKEFGYASCLRNSDKKHPEVKGDCVEDGRVIEPESINPGKDMRIPNSLARTSVELTEDKANTPSEGSSVDCCDSECSFEINVLLPDEAKDIYEQIQKITEEAMAINKPPENETGSSDRGEPSRVGNDKECDKRAQVSHTEFCCLPKYFSTFLKNDTLDVKCQCERATFPADNSEKNSNQEKETSKDTSFSLAEDGNKEVDELKIKSSDPELPVGSNQPISPKDNEQLCRDCDGSPNEKVTSISHTPIILHLLLHGDTEEASYFSKMQPSVKVTCSGAASDSKTTSCNTELKLNETQKEETQSSFCKIPPFEIPAAEVKQGQNDEELFQPTLEALKKCSDQAVGKPPCSKSHEDVFDLSEDEPVLSNDSLSADHLQGKDKNTSSDHELQMDAEVDELVSISDSEQTGDTTSDCLAASQVENSTGEVGFAPKIKTCSPKVSAHLVKRESVPLKEKVVKLKLFGSGCLQKMTVVRSPPKVLCVHLSPRKPTSMEEQSARQRVYDKWKTSRVPVLAVGRRKDETRKGSSILGVDRNRTMLVGSTVTQSLPVRSERWLAKRKRNEIVGLKLKRVRLSSPTKPVKRKGRN